MPSVTWCLRHQYLTPESVGDNPQEFLPARQTRPGQHFAVIRIAALGGKAGFGNPGVLGRKRFAIGIAALTACIQDPGFYRQPADEVTATNARLAALQAELEQAYARWQALE